MLLLNFYLKFNCDFYGRRKDNCFHFGSLFISNILFKVIQSVNQMLKLTTYPQFFVDNFGFQLVMISYFFENIS